MCRKCAGNCPEDSEKAFRVSITALGGKIVGEYLGATKNVHCTCTKGHNCYPAPNNIQQGHGMCRTCAPSSNGEIAITKALESLGLKFEAEFRFKSDRRRYDFCLEKERVMIEFDGIQHFKLAGKWMPTEQSLEANQENDRQKQAIALANGFRVMRFDYTWASHAQNTDLHKFADKIQWFIHQSSDTIWLSTPELYEWLEKPFHVPYEARFTSETTQTHSE